MNQKFSQLLAKLILMVILLPSLFTACSNNNNQNPNRNQNYRYQQQMPYPPTAAPARQDGYYYSPQPYYGGAYGAQPASRHYSNPYALPPQNAYPYYDGDQYYVPPTYYGTNRSDNAESAFVNQKY